jgi:hypothetical protein
MTITQASRQIFQNYLLILDRVFLEEKKTHTLERILQLKSMCQTVINHTSQYDNGKNEMTEDKISRWLGYVQGIMTIYGWITVAAERENTRPLFHQAYEDLGLNKPKSITAKLDDIVFHIVDMQEFNNKCVKKYKVASYKVLPKDKLLKIGFKIMKKSKPTVYKTLKKLNYTYEFNSSSKPNQYSFIFMNLRLKDQK